MAESVNDLTYVLKLVSQETSYLKKRPVGCFLSFMFFLEINSFAPNFVRLAIDLLPPPCSCTEMVALAESQ